MAERNSNNGGRRNSVWSLVLTALIFVMAVTLILYYTVIQPSTSMEVTTFTNTQITADTSGDGVPDGEFATFLEDEDIQTVTIEQSASSDNIYYVSGTYVDSNTTKGFQGTFDENQYNWIVEVMSTRTNSDGSAYFDSTRYSGLTIESTNSVWSWLSPLLYIVVFALLGWFLLRAMSRSMNMGQGQIMSFNQSRAKRETSSKVRFSDVAGCDEVVNELREVVEYFHSNEKYKKMGAKLPKGILLVGPPGTGKTLLAKAVAGEASVPFYSISGSDFVEMYVGVGAGRVRDMFNTAKKNAPCLIFIDEIDAVGRQRGAGLGGGNDEREQTLNQLLVEMDGFEDNSGVIVMAATNRADILDPALLRPGRFDRTITVDLPDREGRAAILKVHGRNKPLASDIDFNSIAARTVGFSGADLANVLNEAAILAVRNNRDRITMPDIDEAIDRRIAGPAKKTHMDDADKRQVAYHEAGHAIVGLTLPDADKVQSVSIIPRGRTGGHTLMAPDRDRFLYTKKMLLARITGYLGGRVSEEVFFGDVSTGASDDFEKATLIARSMVTEYGMSSLGPIQYENPNQDVFLGRDYNNLQRNFSAQVAYEIDEAERKIIEECYAKAKEIITTHKDQVELIANALIQKETITAEEIKYLLVHKELPHYENHYISGPTADPFHGYKPLNPGKITLIPEYSSFYKEVDDILSHGLTDLVVCAYKAGSGPINSDAFRDAIVRMYPAGKAGIIFIGRADLANISASPDIIAQHLEKYSGHEVLLITTDDASVNSLKSLVSSFGEGDKR